MRSIITAIILAGSGLLVAQQPAPNWYSPSEACAEARRALEKAFPAHRGGYCVATRQEVMTRRYPYPPAFRFTPNPKQRPGPPDTLIVADVWKTPSGKWSVAVLTKDGWRVSIEGGALVKAAPEKPTTSAK